MEEVHSSTTHNPTRLMISTHVGFPFSTNEQLIVDMANSAKTTISCLQYCESRTQAIDEQFAKRVHELMHYRTHTVDTDGF